MQHNTHVARNLEEQPTRPLRWTTPSAGPAQNSLLGYGCIENFDKGWVARPIVWATCPCYLVMKIRRLAGVFCGCSCCCCCCVLSFSSWRGFLRPPPPPPPPPLHFILLYIISYVAPPPSCGPSWLPGSSASQAVLLLHALYVSLGCLLCVCPAFSDLYAPLAFCFPFFLSWCLRSPFLVSCSLPAFSVLPFAFRWSWPCASFLELLPFLVSICPFASTIYCLRYSPLLMIYFHFILPCIISCLTYHLICCSSSFLRSVVASWLVCVSGCAPAPCLLCVPWLPPLRLPCLFWSVCSPCLLLPFVLVLMPPVSFSCLMFLACFLSFAFRWSWPCASFLELLPLLLPAARRGPPLHFILPCIISCITVSHIISYVAPPPSCGPSWLHGSSASQAVLLLHALYVSFGCLLCVCPAFSDLYAPLAFCFPLFLSWCLRSPFLVSCSLPAFSVLPFAARHTLVQPCLRTIDKCAKPFF